MIIRVGPSQTSVLPAVIQVRHSSHWIFSAHPSSVLSDDICSLNCHFGEITASHILETATSLFDQKPSDFKCFPGPFSDTGLISWPWFSHATISSFDHIHKDLLNKCV